MLRILNKLFNYKSEREQKLEVFYAHMNVNKFHGSLHASLLRSCDSSSKTYIAIQECFKLLDCYMENRSNSDVALEVISDSYKHRPDLIAILVLPWLLAINTTITPEQIKNLD